MKNMGDLKISGSQPRSQVLNYGWILTFLKACLLVFLLEL